MLTIQSDNGKQGYKVGGKKYRRPKVVLSQGPLRTVLQRLDSETRGILSSQRAGKTAAALRHLQAVPRTILHVRVITGLGIRDHITPALRELHRLPVHQRVKHNVLNILHKTLNSENMSVYLHDRVARRVVGTNLRASGVPKLTVPRTNTSDIADQCFSVAAPSYWNHLPEDLRGGIPLATVKRRLKRTHLFNKYFGQNEPRPIMVPRVQILSVN